MLDDKDEFVSRWEGVLSSTCEGWTEEDAKREAAMITSISHLKFVSLFVDGKWHCVREDWIERMKAKKQV